MTGNIDTIVELETRFWQALVDNDTKLAKSMVADECLLASPMGSRRIDPDRFEAMAEDGRWRLDSFAFDDVEVIFPAADVAVITYRVRQTGEMNGEAMDMTCVDSSTWVRTGDAWKCALHTETIL